MIDMGRYNRITAQSSQFAISNAFQVRNESLMRNPIFALVCCCVHSFVNLQRMQISVKTCASMCSQYFHGSALMDRDYLSPGLIGCAHAWAVGFAGCEN